MTSTGAAPDAPARGRPWLRVVLAIVVLAALVAAGRAAGPAIQDFNRWVDGLGAWGPAVFIAGYAAAVIAFVPGSILTLGAGVLFGVAAGTGYVFVAATLGACGAFLVARYLARDWVAGRIAGSERFAAIDRAVGTEGRKIVFLLRLSPIFPFNLLNYALGLTSVRFGDYAIASLGMLPGTLLYVYLGSALGNLAAVAAGDPGGDGRRRAIFVGGLVVTVVVTVLVTRIARRALAEATGGSLAGREA